MEAEIYEYSDKKLLVVAETINAVVSGLLPVLSIVVLYFVHNPAAKLGAIVSFTILFGLALATMTKCRRIDVIAATAA